MIKSKIKSIVSLLLVAVIFMTGCSAKIDVTEKLNGITVLLNELEAEEKLFKATEDEMNEVHDEYNGYLDFFEKHKDEKLYLVVHVYSRTLVDLDDDEYISYETTETGDIHKWIDFISKIELSDRYSKDYPTFGEEDIYKTEQIGLWFSTTPPSENADEAHEDVDEDNIIMVVLGFPFIWTDIGNSLISNYRKLLPEYEIMVDELIKNGERKTILWA